MTMERINLNDSGVLFDKENHTYELNGVMLSGITETLQRQLYPDEYKDIPKAILEKAGEYGTSVHESCELFDREWINDGTIEVQDYISICKENGLTHEASEYTVTDGRHWASNIDKVFRASDDTFDLADIKTYGSFTTQKLRKAQWQLSVYAYLFSLVNPEAKVGRLIVIHLRNKQKKDGTFDHQQNIMFVERIPSEIVKELLTADEENRQFLNPYDIPAEYAAKEQRIRELIKMKTETEEELGSIKTSFMQVMEQLNVTNWTTESGMKITRKLPTTRSSFNLALFRKKNPNFEMEQYMKTSNVAGSLSIAI